jgi:hypothetical protein
METLIALGLGSLASWLQGEKAKGLKKWQRFAISMTACLVVGLFTTYLQVLQGGEFDINALMGNLGVAFTASQTFYNLYFKKLT